MLGLIDRHYKSTFGNLFKGPFAFGHECIAEVVEVGERVINIKIGDVVSVPFQISCGACSHCNLGLTSACQKTRMYPLMNLESICNLVGQCQTTLKFPMQMLCY